MQTEIELCYTPNKKHYMSAGRLVMYDFMFGKKEIYITAIGFVISTLIWLFYSRALLVDIFIAFFGLALCFICLYYYVLPSTLYDRGVTGIGEITQIFCDAGIEARSKQTNSRIEWDYFKEAWEANDYFLLFGSGQQYHLVPKSAFKDNEQIIAFKEFLINKMGKVMMKQ